MNLTQLYAATPVSRHADILTDGAHIYVKNADGDLDHYLLLSDGELWKLPGDVNLSASLRAAKATIDALTTTLSQAKTAIVNLQTDVTALKTSVGKIAGKVGA